MSTVTTSIALIACFMFITYGGGFEEHTHDHRYETLLTDDDGNELGRACPTEEYNEALLAKDPEWRASLEEFERNWRVQSAAIQSGEVSVEMNSVNVPIIFHIVMQNPTQIPDSAIAYQMNVLSADFSASNSDYTSGTPTEFRAVRSGNTGITFTLNQRINKVTSVSSFSTNNAIKFDNQGGSNVVSPNSNLNFWVGNLNGGVLGYAQFPGGSSSTDGIVDAPGTLAPSVGSPPYNLGRTATHEIGHWLNLRHIWGDNSQCTNTQFASDFVIDTPPSSAANFGCPAGTKRCSQNTYTQDMYMNYMDYVYDECMVMFTELQNARAWASIDQYRQGFNPSRYADEEYINWLYFNRFEDTEPEQDGKCYGDHILFYDNNINEGSDSNIYIYGCMMKTTNMNVDHMTDIKFVSNDGECDDEYTQATQDLNEGNDGESIYLCYAKEESTEDNENMAILDITFVKEGDAMTLDLDEWTINTKDNVNPNGVKLNFAMKKGEYYNDITVQGVINADSKGMTNDNITYIGFAAGAVLLAAIAIGVIVWKYVCSRKGFKEYMVNETLNNEYGSTVAAECELAQRGV